MKINFLTTCLILTTFFVKAQFEEDRGNLSYCQQQVFQSLNQINGLLNQLSQCNPNASGYYVQSITNSETYQIITTQPSEYWLADCSNFNSYFHRWIESIDNSINESCR